MDRANPGRPRQPSMLQRDRGGSFAIDNPDDGSPIKEMISLKDRLLIITEKCTYELQTADQIDPQRSNPRLPHNVQRRLFDLGIGSEALAKVFLQTTMLCKEGHLPLDVLKAQRLALEALTEFAAMDHTAKAFKEIEKAGIERAEKGNVQRGSLALPTIGGVDAHCKTFAQKAHFFGRAMLSVARLFYPKASNWDKLQEIVTTEFGPGDQFSKLLADVIPNLKMVLNLRDALEHQMQGVCVKDFTLEKNGNIAPPTVELNFRKSVLPRCSVVSLMDGLIVALPVYFEMMIVHLSSKFVLPVAGLPLSVALLPDTFQQAKHVRFGYWAQTPDGRALPFG
jgi:hypothetical protein